MFENKYSINTTKYEILEEDGDWIYCKKLHDHSLPSTTATCDIIEETGLPITAEIFANCPFINKITDGYDVKLIAIGGGRAMNFSDNYSDIDLNIFVSDASNLPVDNTDYALFYKSYRMHWYYCNIDSIWNTGSAKIYFNGAWFFEMGRLPSNNALILSNNDADNVILQKLSFNADLLTRLGICECLQELHHKCNVIKGMIAANSIPDGVRWKIMASTLWMYSEYVNAGFDKLILLKAKRSPWYQLTDDDKALFLEYIKQFDAYCEQNGWYEEGLVDKLAAEF